MGCRGGGGGGGGSDHLVSSPLSLPWEHLPPPAPSHLPTPAERKGISLPWEHLALQPCLQDPEEGTLRVEASLLVTIFPLELNPFHFWNERVLLTSPVLCCLLIHEYLRTWQCHLLLSVSKTKYGINLSTYRDVVWKNQDTCPLLPTCDVILQ